MYSIYFDNCSLVLNYSNNIRTSQYANEYSMKQNTHQRCILANKLLGLASLGY